MARNGLFADVPNDTHFNLLELQKERKLIMSELWIEIYNHLTERDADAIKMQNAVNTEMERMLVLTKINCQK